MSQNYRLYTFVANHYLSPLQCGLQTAHVVSELSLFKRGTSQANAFNEWALSDKTIIICAAGNHAGVVECGAELVRTAMNPLGLPVATFYEDEQSMNKMATACGVIVPQKYWDVKFDHLETTYEGATPEKNPDQFFWEHIDANFKARRYPLTHPEGQFINHIKKYRLA